MGMSTKDTDRGEGPREISAETLKRRIDAGDVVVIEVLQPREFDRGHLPGAINIPFRYVGSEARKRFARDDTIVVYCHDEACRASRVAASKLRELGFSDVREFSGGKRAWEEAGYSLSLWVRDKRTEGLRPRCCETGVVRSATRGTSESRTVFMVPVCGYETTRERVKGTSCGMMRNITIPGMTPPQRFASFRRRLNRFVVEVALIDDGSADEPSAGAHDGPGETTTASLPNPGRMQELLLPGSRLGLVAGPSNGRHPWKAISVHRGEETIPLNTAAANAVAEHLLRAGLIPGLEEWTVERREVTVPGGHSRFDVLLKPRDECDDDALSRVEGMNDAPGRRGAADPEEFNPLRRRYLEVKSCTLFNGDWALFPDAVTDRGRRHVEELARTDGGVLLVLVHSPTVTFFSPDIHVDPDFAAALYAARHAVDIIPVALHWTSDFELAMRPRRLDVPWSRIAPLLADRGGFFALVHLSKSVRIPGFDGEPVVLHAGYYGLAGEGTERTLNRLRRAPRRAARRGNDRRHVDGSPTVPPHDAALGIGTATAESVRRFLDAWIWVDGYVIRSTGAVRDRVVQAMSAVGGTVLPLDAELLGDTLQSNHGAVSVVSWRYDPRTTVEFQRMMLLLRRAPLEKE